MRVVIEPGLLRGELCAAPSKSDAHRQLIAAALSDGPTRIRIGALSGDIQATVRCLRALGAEIGALPDGLQVTPIGRARGDCEPGAELDCGESGSTLRFLLPLAPALGAEARFLAHGRLGERPNAALLSALRAHGAIIEGESPPLWVRGKLGPGVYELPGNVSSQYATGLLMALPLLDAQSEIRFSTHVESGAYIELTLEALEKYGIRIERTAHGYRVPAPQRYRSPGLALVEGDWSNAAFFLAASALGGEVRLFGLNPRSAQGDRQMPALIDQMNVPGECAIDASGVPDLVPILAVLATQRDGMTRIERAARLRIKECDRLAAIRECLGALGADIAETQDGLVIRGGILLRGGVVSSHNDHRIAMAMAIAATVALGPVIIEGAEAVNKSYPGFFEDFIKLGGRAHVEHIRT